MKIALATAIHRRLPRELRNRCLENLHDIAVRDDHDFAIFADFREMPAEPTEAAPWSRIVRVGDRALHALKLDEWDYVLWTDADVVTIPWDICSRLIDLNPGGITAPIPMIEKSNRLYDTFGCVDINGRHLVNDFPYWKEPQEGRLIPMKAVGMTLLVPGWVFHKSGCIFHPSQTGWYAACNLAREAGLTVGIDLGTVAEHADLPKYGLNWH